MQKRKWFKRGTFWLGFLAAAIILIGIEFGAQATSTNKFCEICHFHPHSTTSWKTSPHVDNPYGIKVKCVECHLPPKDGIDYYTAKAITGARDVWGKITK